LRSSANRAVFLFLVLTHIPQALPDDTLEATGADAIEERRAVLERRDELHI
jgi:hypothetical protein